MLPEMVTWKKYVVRVILLNKEKVKELVNVENVNGRRAATRSTALYIACEKGHFDVIQYLIERIQSVHQCSL